jgi:hypothetical protein
MPLSETRTGYDVQESGEYVNDCCLVEQHLAADDTFPRCPNCLHLCIWETAYVPVRKAA